MPEHSQDSAGGTEQPGPPGGRERWSLQRFVGRLLAYATQMLPNVLYPTLQVQAPS